MSSPCTRVPPAILALLCCLGSTLTSAADTTSDRARELVKEALHREIYGLEQERDALLQQALSARPDFAPAMWHQGYVRTGDGWSYFHDVARVTAGDSRLAGYDLQRDASEDDLNGHLGLANWCSARGLRDQERAHLTRVLDFDSEHAEARERLGFRLIAGRWVSAEESAAEMQRLAASRESIDKWRGEFIEIRKRLHDRSAERQQAACARLMGVASSETIPVMEDVLSLDSQAVAKLVVSILAKMPEQEAVASLIRHAIFSPWPEVRDEASLQLRQRPREAYVPLLLAEMYTPVASRTNVAPVNGRLLYQHSFLREGQDERQLLILNTEYRRRAAPGGNGNATLMRALWNSMGSARSLELAVQQQNLRTDLINDRIARVLNLATQQQLPSNPQLWWQWWDHQNDVVFQGPKQTRTQEQTRQVSFSDQVPGQRQVTGGAQIAGTPGRQRGECFVAGTPVWTSGGMMAIEALRVGDMVLSQDIESGELTYKPVLRTTVRPPERLIKVQVGEESFTTTRGHLFWVSGSGWTRAAELRSGMPLHAIDGASQVLTVEFGEAAETYNLIVADFNTYVVGDSKLLSHDVTDRRPTFVAVPGLK